MEFKVSLPFYQTLLVNPFQNQMTSVHTFAPYFFMIHFNINFPLISSSKNMVFLIVTPCNSERAQYSVSFLAYSLALKMEEEYSSKTLGCLWTTQCYNPVDCTLHNHHCENCVFIPWLPPAFFVPLISSSTKQDGRGVTL
jgi:hypothetical protein